MKQFYKNLIAITILSVLFLPIFVLAASDAYNNLEKVGSGGDNAANAPYAKISDPTGGANSLTGIIGVVIQAFLGLLGVLFLTYLLYAGYSWMTAQGDEEKVTKAKETIQRAIIGLIVTIGAYAISYFVLEKLVFKGGILR